MDIVLFLLGALGALITVYLAKQEVIPEFRPLFETSEKEEEVSEHKKHTQKTGKDIDSIQAKLREPSLPDDLTQRLTTVLKTSLDEINIERARLRTLEREIKQSQVISRGLGFLFYIILGGVFGSLLAGQVQIGELTGDLPNIFEAIVIGATWTTYLSTIGVRLGQKKADERIEASQKDSAKIINTAKNEIKAEATQMIEKAYKDKKAEQRISAIDEIEKMVDDRLGLTLLNVEENLNLARQMVQRDIKGVL